MSGWEPQSEFLRELNAKAKVEGRAEAEDELRQLLREAVRSLLRHRFGALTPGQSQRLESASLTSLKRWIFEAVTAPSIDAALID